MDYQIATCSYFEFKPGMGIAAQSSLGTPKWPLGYRLDERAAIWEVTPRYFYLRKPREIYEGAYWAQLDRYGVRAIQGKIDTIRGLFGGGPVVLLCFDNLAKPDGWCHRRMFADWWLRSTGEEVPELGKTCPDTPVAPAPSLFD